MPRSNSKEDQTCKFIFKLWSILQKKQYDSIVTWSTSGNSFQILDPKAFQEQILPLYFRHGKLKSFIRQLNMYRFKKVRNCGEILVFKNAFFNRAENEQLHMIQRKVPKKMQMIDKSQQIEDSSFEKKSNHQQQNLKEKEKEYQNRVVEEQYFNPPRHWKIKSNCRLQQNSFAIPLIAPYSFASNPNHHSEDDDGQSVSINQKIMKNNGGTLTDWRQSGALL